MNSETRTLNTEFISHLRLEIPIITVRYFVSMFKFVCLVCPTFIFRGRLKRKLTKAIRTINT